ncbi:MAG: type VI secretion system tip protein VgrG [Planctomycetes bacterium]|nr:type VI secretion system tip protein VgrG [Planctomycetota bacterium]MCB9890888.1 type VI secretion system tip protein VgrG [Planctomycetota bacterium]
MSFTQDDLPLQVATVLGKDTLFLRSFQGQESCSRTFHYELDLLGDDPSIDLAALIDSSLTFEIGGRGAKNPRNGVVSRAAHAGRLGRFSVYRVTVVPSLWKLSLRTDCRIFQQMTVPDIVKKILDEASIKDAKFSVTGSYSKRDYCVQYMESSLDFIARLLEEEGIAYHFEHTTSAHTVVFTDDNDGFTACPNAPTARFELTRGGFRDDDVIDQLFVEHALQSDKYAHADYNFETPSTKLRSEVGSTKALEVYEYPGGFGKSADGDALARRRYEGFRAGTVRVKGSSDCRGFYAGHTVKLTDHHREDINEKEHLILSLAHRGGQEIDGEGAMDPAGIAVDYANEFELMPKSEPYRPPRATRRPTIQGVQTAVVTGKSGEEIWTDKHARVKVQFHWDREGKLDENTSCWVRVSQAWAGTGWGALFLPRIGQEVIVGFEEGDPDRPVITGRVYNAEKTPAFSLPGNQNISGVRTRSTKGGSGGNENIIAFDDTKGSELLTVHAEKDHLVQVENDKVENVGRDRSQTIGRDQKTEVGRDHTEGVKGNMTITVAQNLTETVAINYAETVGAAMELTIGGLFAETVGANKTQAIGLNSSETVGKDKALDVGKNLSETVGEAHKLEVGKDSDEKVGAKKSLEVKESYRVSAQKIQLVAKDELSIKVGKAEIVLKKSGDISIKGKKIQVKGSGDVIVKGSKVKEN